MKLIRQKIGELSINVTDGEHGSVIDDKNGLYYLLSNKNIKNGYVKFDENDRKISAKSFRKINKRTKLEIDDVIIATVGSIGRTAIIRDKNLNYDFQRSVGIIKTDSKQLLPQYLHYYFQLPYVQKRLKNLSKGAVQQCLFISDLKDIDIDVPNVFSYQEKITKVLSDLDAKIELNNKINTELEAMAKLIHDYWFVQFDFPDENGKPYKSSGGKMEYNGELKREIPEGWGVDKLSSCCKIIDCLHSKKSGYLFEDEKYYLLQLENIREDGLIDQSEKYYVSQDEYQRWTTRIEVKDHDLVITNAGRVAGLAQIPTDIVAGIGRNITAIRPDTIQPTFLYYSFQGAEMKRQIKLNTDTGSFFQSLNVRGIKELFIIRPPKSLEEKFEQIAIPKRRKRELNINQNQKLSELRDWLLPMLMNGQVKVE